MVSFLRLRILEVFELISIVVLVFRVGVSIFVHLAVAIAHIPACSGYVRKWGYCWLRQTYFSPYWVVFCSFLPELVGWCPLAVWFMATLFLFQNSIPIVQLFGISPLSIWLSAIGFHNLLEISYCQILGQWWKKNFLHRKLMKSRPKLNKYWTESSWKLWFLPIIERSILILKFLRQSTCTHRKSLM